ncbi:MAG: hypothetical protein FJ138_10760, partial [Deltaproteobacteria bacterium]|nr:hypothetical protein [Deltaproteobacteria bacterium]
MSREPSRELMFELEEQARALRERGAWEEVEALYENLCHLAPSIEQRLFYAWERAEVLAERLEAPVAAIHVLREAQLTGGPLGVISLRVEQIRLSRASTPLAAAVNDAALRAYDDMLSLAEGRGEGAHPDAARVRAWHEAVAPAPRPLTPLVTPSPAAPAPAMPALAPAAAPALAPEATSAEGGRLPGGAGFSGARAERSSEGGAEGGAEGFAEGGAEGFAEGAAEGGAEAGADAGAEGFAE